MTGRFVTDPIWVKGVEGALTIGKEQEGRRVGGEGGTFPLSEEARVMERDVSGDKTVSSFSSLLALRLDFESTGQANKEGWILEGRDRVRRSPKIQTKGCTVEEPRTLNSSESHQENSPILTASSEKLASSTGFSSDS